MLINTPRKIRNLTIALNIYITKYLKMKVTSNAVVMIITITVSSKE